jgi:hypothetical protein
MPASKGRKAQFRQWLDSERGEWLVTGSTGYDAIAVQELCLAQAQAEREAARGRSRPYRADRSVTAIVLLTMALEAWVNTELTVAYHMRSLAEAEKDRLMSDLLDAPLDRKLRCLPRYRGGETLHPQQLPDISVVVSIRHELIHHLPATNERGDLDRLQDLGIDNLLLSAPTHPEDGPDTPQTNYLLHDRLATYDLAYWCFAVVESTIQQVIGACTAHNISMGLINLHRFRACRTPAAIASSMRGP